MPSFNTDSSNKWGEYLKLQRDICIFSLLCVCLHAMRFQKQFFRRKRYYSCYHTHFVCCVQYPLINLKVFSSRAGLTCTCHRTFCWLVLLFPRPLDRMPDRFHGCLCRMICLDVRYKAKTFKNFNAFWRRSPNHITI